VAATNGMTSNFCVLGGAPWATYDRRKGFTDCLAIPLLPDSPPPATRALPLVHLLPLADCASHHCIKHRHCNALTYCPAGGAPSILPVVTNEHPPRHLVCLIRSSHQSAICYQYLPFPMTLACRDCLPARAGRRWRATFAFVSGGRRAPGPRRDAWLNWADTLIFFYIKLGGGRLGGQGLPAPHLHTY